MASLIMRSLRRTSAYGRRFESATHPSKCHFHLPRPWASCDGGARTYISEMRKSAFEGNILRLLRSEIQYELECAPPLEPEKKYDSFTVNERPGEQWVSLKRKFGDNEDIHVEATMFDGAIPASKAGDGITEEMQLHITLIVNISKGKDDEILEIMCSAWPDSLEIRKLLVRTRQKIPYPIYTGPGFKELDDELQEALYEFLEERGIDDQLATFLHQYMGNKDKIEYIRWMETVKSFVENK
ncbi:hypothetical protein MLD38_019232 [Melastoma candidum]|uniref:Uncharacterized protein n=1 Tax=Melastoma candidum TaxID=119954 RepID=A0ACB9QXG7_9MYRT|nr:hypothetical protein MLD38_019232 [Melastoma candidum]